MRLRIELGDEYFDESKMEFFYTNNVTIEMEHSLFTISKWEMKYKKPFIEKKEAKTKTEEEVKDYVKMMIINMDEKDITDDIVNTLFTKHSHKINEFINDNMTATTFRNEKKGHSSEIITSELIYYWMILNEIPVEFEHWHLSRLLTLIRICNIKNSPPKKRSARDIMSENNRINAARRAKYGSKG